MKQNGFSLLEIVIALFLSSLLMITLTRVYLNVKVNYRFQEKFASFQEEGRFITALLTKRIHRADDTSCMKFSKSIKSMMVIHGYSAVQLPQDTTAEKNTDAMMIGECLWYQQHQQFVRMLYFIGDTGRKNKKGKSILALYQKPFKGRREELVSHIANMKIQYGITSTNKKEITHYVSAEAVKDWRLVRAVDVSLFFDELQKSWHIFIALYGRL